MKKKLLSLLVLLMAVVTSAWAQEKVAYAQWDRNSATLTFKYDANMPTRNAWLMNEETSRPGWYSTARSSLTKVVFDASFAEARPTSLYMWFDRCSKLESIEGIENLHASEVTNSDMMFYECSALTSVTLPNGLTMIGNYAFGQCTGLTSITIPESVTTVGDLAFYNCTSLTELLYNSKLFVFMPTSTEGEYTIPDGITTIAPYAFQNCSNLTKITIPESVTTVGNYAFQNCYNLTEAIYNSKLFAFMPTSKEGEYTVPDGITTIAPNAFQNCNKLTKITIPESVTTIGDYAFSYCNALTSITIPANVTSIGRYAFEGCAGLIEVFVNATTPPTLYDWSTFNYDFDGKIYVPAASVDAYKTAEYWNQYSDKIEDNLPKVSWASNASTDGWTVTVDGTALTLPASVDEGKTVIVEYTGTRTVGLPLAIDSEKDGNKWTFKMGDKPISLNPILGVAVIGENVYASFEKAIDAISQTIQKPTTIKLVWDAAINSYLYLNYDTTIDLNGYSISKMSDWCNFYLYNNITVTDTSDGQKGGVKLKFENRSNYKLSFMAGRYVYTADEINSNNYYAFGYIAENINADGSADADGYFSKMRAMTAEEKAQAAYDLSKAKIVYTIEGVGTTEIPVIKYQDVRLTPPAGWKFGTLKRMDQWGGYNDYAQYSSDYYWDGQTFKLNGNDVTESSIEINATLVPNSVVENLYGITATLSADKTAITLKGAGGKTVIVYSEKGETLFTQTVEKGNLATFKGLAVGKTYYLGVDGELLKVNTGE